MGDITEVVNAVFYISLCTILCTSISLAFKYCYKSKCKDVDICCIKIKRDIEVELQEDINIHSNSRDSIRLESPINYRNNK